MSAPLSPDAEKHLAAMFAAKDQPTARAILRDECGMNLPGLRLADAIVLDRFRFAALKLSEGRLDKLRQAVKLAQEDWRDLLMAAGFGHDTKAHLSWTPQPEPRTK
jgi:hypothetical protein